MQQEHLQTLCSICVLLNIQWVFRAILTLWIWDCFSNRVEFPGKRLFSDVLNCSGFCKCCEVMLKTWTNFALSHGFLEKKYNFSTRKLLHLNGGLIYSIENELFSSFLVCNLWRDWGLSVKAFPFLNSMKKVYPRLKWLSLNLFLCNSLKNIRVLFFYCICWSKRAEASGIESNLAESQK